MANPGIQQVRPQTRREFMDKLYIPTDPEYGNPNLTFSDPFKPGQPEHNRAYEVSYSELDTKNFSIGIKDHTEAIQYYFDEVLKLEVYQNNGKVLVPVIYGTPEKWKSMQKIVLALGLSKTLTSMQIVTLTWKQAGTLTQKLKEKNTLML
jgi:hypothetical protein